MSEAIKRRRGTTAEHAAFTGLEGEITVDTTKKVVVVHDGVTPGGIPLARADETGGGSAEEITYDGTMSGLAATDLQAAVDELAATVENRPLRGHIHGLEVANDPSNPNTHVIVAAGEAASDNGLSLINLQAGITKNLATAWVAGTGNGALDVAGPLAANSWYHIFLIKNPTTGAVDILASGSISNPAMPSGYTLRRRVRSQITNASGFLIPTIQVGDYVGYKTPIINLSSVENGGSTLSLRTVSVPLGSKFNAELAVVTAGTSTAFGAVCDPDNGAISVNNVAYHRVGGGISSTVVLCHTDVNGRVATWDAGATAGGATLSIWTRGYYDRRGRS